MKSGALDFKSKERLQTLDLLRKVASQNCGKDLEDLSEPVALLTFGRSGAAGASSSRSSQGSRMTDFERAARRSDGSPGLDWATWESRWAEQLKGLAEAASTAKRAAAAHRMQAQFDANAEATQPRVRSTRRGGAVPTRGMPSSASSSSSTSEMDEEAEIDRRWRSSQQYREQRQQQQRAKQDGQQKQPVPPQPPPPPPPRPAARPSPPVGAGRHFDSWSAFDSAFVEWEKRAASDAVIHLKDVPFPPPRDPAGLVEKGLLRGDGNDAERKKMLRKALLRWHPDKWVHLGHKLADEEKGALGERLSTITQALVEQKDSA